MLPTWTNSHIYCEKFDVGGNTWSQQVTEAFSFLQLAPRALTLVDLDFLNKI